MPRRACLVAIAAAACVACAPEPRSRVVAGAVPAAPVPHAADPRPAPTLRDVGSTAVVHAPAPAADPTLAVPAPLACIVRYYKATARYEDGAWFLVLPDDTKVPYAHDRIPIGNGYYWPNVTDIYEQRYPTGPIHPVTQVNFDPGAMRLDPLFYATYGRTAKEVRSKLVRVLLGGKVFLVHRRIAAPLRRVAVRIQAAIEKNPKLSRFFQSPGGTFNWRHIAGTDALSSHGWGIAIDLDTKRADYWRYQTANPDGSFKWRNRYPQAIVDAFEGEGFIWGGRWYHFDTMHFEYRPELTDPACYPH
jgi:D-alanyl-D-alanine carboxypeptidase